MQFLLTLSEVRGAGLGKDSSALRRGQLVTPSDRTVFGFVERAGTLLGGLAGGSTY